MYQANNSNNDITDLTETLNGHKLSLAVCTHIPLLARLGSPWHEPTPDCYLYDVGASYTLEKNSQNVNNKPKQRAQI